MTHLKQLSCNVGLDIMPLRKEYYSAEWFHRQETLRQKAHIDT